MRLAHDAETPPTFGTWFCSCHGCAVAAQALAHTDPAARVVIKWARAPREVVSIAAWVRDGHRVEEFAQPGDYVREVFLADPAGGAR